MINLIVRSWWRCTKVLLRVSLGRFDMVLPAFAHGMPASFFIESAVILLTWIGHKILYQMKQW
jgi:hypothetical protein